MKDIWRHGLLGLVLICVAFPFVSTSGADQMKITPKRPYAMTVGPTGTLYIVDPGRDQILRWSEEGGFGVVAGSGMKGFSGDGGPAIDATLRLNYQAGIAVASNGTVYFADAGNGRVREVLPSGIIRTVAGGGTAQLGLGSVPALRATFGGPWSVFGLAIGPGGRLYIGCMSGVYKLTKDGMLRWVVGSNAPRLNKGYKGVYADPAGQADFVHAAKLAFDGEGDLFVAGGGGFGLYERAVTGRLRFIEIFRGDGYWGSLAEASEGSVVLAARLGLTRIQPSGHIVSVPASRLSAALGGHNTFIVGDGVATAPNGDIYLDTNPDNAFTLVAAIVRVSPRGHVTLVWRS